MYIYRLLHALGNAGHKVDVVHCVDSYHLLHAAPPEITFPEHPNVQRHELKSGYRWLSPLLTQQTGQPLLKRRQISGILNRRYDVIHFHNMSLLGPGLLRIESSGPAVKLYTAHEHWLVCPMHVLWKFTQEPCVKPQCISCVILSGRPPQLWRYTGLLRKTCRHVDQFLSPSQFTATMHAERGFPEPVLPMPYFIEPSDQDWMNPGPRFQEEPYFLFVGRLELIKGLQTLIEVWRKVPDFDLLVAGTGKYADHLRSQAASIPRIKFLGPLPQAQLGNLYFHAVASIIPSITYETFGMINIESFARKTPVIARNLGALPEVIKESGGGLTYETDEQLLDAINQIGRSLSLRNELGEKGYSTFLKKWTKSAHLELYFDLLRQTAKRKFGFVPWE